MASVWVAPPADGTRSPITVNGRSYACAVGAAISVPDFDAAVLHANGWTTLPVSAPLGLASSVSPGSMISIDPATGDIYQTSGS